jgi:hypothetical protein
MRKALLFVALLLANVASARELVRLTAPARAVLDGGARAEVAWEADRPLPAQIGEWEAFLSVDGGRHYRTRITPHLDARVRRFTFNVPNVSSTDARILLRLGDEEHERIVHLPQSFVIVGDLPKFALAQAVKPAEHEGESALFDDEHVSEWVTGDLVTHLHRDRASLAAINAFAADDTPPSNVPRDATARARRPRAASIATAPTIEPQRIAQAHPARDTLLLTTRLNV